MVDLREIGGLDLRANADELLAEGILGGSDKHLALQLGRVGSPGRKMTSGEAGRATDGSRKKNAAELIVPDNEEDLVAETTLLLVLEVEDSVSGVILGEASDELLVGGSLGGSLLDNNLGVVGVNGEDNVAVGLAELELLELLHARVRDLDARGLRGGV